MKCPWVALVLATVAVGCTSPPTIMDVVDGSRSEASTDAGIVAMDVVEPDVMGSCPDMDNDGHRAASCGGDDCDDTNARRNPAVREVCDNLGLDEDCDPCTVGEVLPNGRGGDSDRDEDGFPSRSCFNRLGEGSRTPECGGGAVGDGGAGEDGGAAVSRVSVSAMEVRGTDCDDSSIVRNPASSERCDDRLVDENCNGTANEGCECPTATDPAVSRRCMGAMGECARGTQDCVDGRWSMCSTAPAPETCNMRDDDCDGVVDNEPASSTECASSVPGRVCTGGVCSCPPNSVVCGGSCVRVNDTCTVGVGACRRTGTIQCAGDAMVGTARCNAVAGAPAPRELCDAPVAGMPPIDEDCDGVANPLSLCPCTFNQTRRCPALGACALGTQTCSATGTWSTCSVVPQAETCDAMGVDQDCNGQSDDVQARVAPTTISGESTFYRDADLDRYGNPAVSVVACVAPAGYVANNTDCDDTSAVAASRYPGNTEVCDAIDQNCDGSTSQGPCTAATGQSCMSGTCLCPAGQIPCSGACRAPSCTAGSSCRACVGVRGEAVVPGSNTCAAGACGGPTCVPRTGLVANACSGGGIGGYAFGHECGAADGTCGWWTRYGTDPWGCRAIYDGFVALPPGGYHYELDVRSPGASQIRARAIDAVGASRAEIVCNLASAWSACRVYFRIDTTCQTVGVSAFWLNGNSAVFGSIRLYRDSD